MTEPAVVSGARRPTSSRSPRRRPTRGPAPPRSRRLARLRDALIRSLVPVILALLAGGVLLAILGRDPFTFYSDIWQYGVQQGSWQDSAMLAAPLLLIAVGLIVSSAPTSGTSATTASTCSAPR